MIYYSQDVKIQVTKESGKQHEKCLHSHTKAPVQNYPRLLASNQNVRRASNEIFQTLKISKCEPKTIQPVNLSFKTNGEMRAFQDKYNFK